MNRFWVGSGRGFTVSLQFSRAILGLYCCYFWGHIGDILGVHWGYVGDILGLFRGLRV